MDLLKLSAPFDIEDIEWRVQRSGVNNGKPWAMALVYVTNRAIQQRLDDVCSPLGWKNEYLPAPDGGVMCGISIWDGDKKQWVSKFDGAENTNVEAVKGGLSSAMKRAGSQWGIGRYLYKLTVMFAQCQIERPQNRHGWGEVFDKKTKTKFYWQEPILPAWALPEKEAR